MAALLFLSSTLLYYILSGAQVLQAQNEIPCQTIGHHEVVFHWPDGLTVNWPNTSFSTLYENKKKQPIGVKVYKDRIFFQVPRWYGNDLPINMAVAARPKLGTCLDKPTTPALNPYPSWEMNLLGDCSAFQYVQSMSIETDGTAWLHDLGRQIGKPSPCKPKLIIMDLNTDKIIHIHTFPESVVPSTVDQSFLNDITLDVSDPDNKFAFISESDQAAIIVYSRKQDKSWKAQHSSMQANNLLSLTTFLVDPPATRHIRNNSINGITTTSARSGSKKVFYNPMTSYETFEVDTAALEDEEIATDPEKLGLYVRKFTDKISKSDGLIVDDENTLYMTEIEQNAISTWNVSDSGSRSDFFQDNTTGIWPDTLAIDEDEGYLWFTTRGYPIDSYSRLVRVYIGQKSGNYVEN